MLIEIGQTARAASKSLANAGPGTKNDALRALASLIAQSHSAILAANNADVAEGQSSGMSAALIDRLMLTDKRLDSLSADLIHVAELVDPIGQDFCIDTTKARYMLGYQPACDIRGLIDRAIAFRQSGAQRRQRSGYAG